MSTFSLGRSLSNVFATWARLWLWPAAYLAAADVPMILIDSAQPVRGQWTSLVLVVLTKLLFGVPALAAGTHLVVVTLSRSPLSVAGSATAVLRRMPSLLGVAVSVGARPAVVGAAGAFAAYSAFDVDRLWSLSLVVVVAAGTTLLMLAIAVPFFAAFPAVSVERLGASAAMLRSRELTAGLRASLYGGALLLTMAMAAPSMILYWTLGRGDLVLPPSPLARAGLHIFDVVVASLLPAALGVAYHDLRVAKEGVASEDLAATFG
jgi:hypothetical protein